MAETLDAFFPRWIAFWEREGHRISTVSAGRPAVVAPGGHFEQRWLTQRPGPRLLLAQGALRRAIDAIHPDVVLTSTATVSAILRLRPLRCPVVYFCHGFHWSVPSPSPFGRIAQAVEVLLLHRTAGVIVINSDDLRFVQGRVPPRQVLYLRGSVGLDPDVWVPSAPAAEAPPRILVVGSLTRRKRPLLALSAFQHLVGDIPAAQRPRLVFAGDGPLAGRLEKAVRDRGLGAHVELLGHTDARREMLRASLVLHTARWEGLGLGPLEAVALGRPVVAVNVKGVRDIPRVTFADSAEPSALADAIAGCLRTAPFRVPERLPDAYSDVRAHDEVTHFIDRIVRLRDDEAGLGPGG